MAEAVLGAVDTAINRYTDVSHGTYISSSSRQTNDQEITVNNKHFKQIIREYESWRLLP